MESVFHLSAATREPTILQSSMSLGRVKECPSYSGSEYIFLTDVGKTVFDISELLLGKIGKISLKDTGDPMDWVIKVSHSDGDLRLGCHHHLKDSLDPRVSMYLVLEITAEPAIVENFIHNLLFRLNRDPADFADWESVARSSGINRQEIHDAWESHFLRPILEMQNLINYAKDFGLDTTNADTYLQEAIDSFNQRHYQDMMSWVDMVREVARTRYADYAQEEVKRILEIKKNTGEDTSDIRKRRIRTQIEEWVAEGFMVDDLTRKLEQNDPNLYDNFIRTADSIIKLRGIRKRLNEVPAGALDHEVEKILVMTLNPELLPSIVERIAEIEGKLNSASEEDIRNGFRMRLEGYKLEGFLVDPLERHIEDPLSTLKEEFQRFEDLAEEARDIRERIKKVDFQGFEDELEAVRKLLRDPRMVDEAREMIGAVKDGHKTVVEPVVEPARERRKGRGLSALIPGKGRDKE